MKVTERLKNCSGEITVFFLTTGTINEKHLQIFNLTSLTKSEDVLSATLHYYIGDLQNSTWGCSRSKSCGRHALLRHNHIHMVIWSFASIDNKMRSLGHLRINVSTLYRDFISWQWKDITRVVNQAKHHEELLIGIDVASQGPQPWKKLLSDRSPYILVYANDSAISEPESVVATLQRHGSGPNKGQMPHRPQKVGAQERNNTEHLQPRHRRSVNVLLPLQNNELPGSEYPYETTGWDETSPHEPFKKKQSRRPRKKTRKNQQQKMPLLQFDEQTIKKARKKQWNEPRTCARRYLKVDFADIGWNDWIISPKSFDAYYCSGSCQFPMPKVRIISADCSHSTPGNKKVVVSQSVYIFFFFYVKNISFELTASSTWSASGKPQVCRLFSARLPLVQACSSRRSPEF